MTLTGKSIALAFAIAATPSALMPAIAASDDAPRHMNVRGGSEIATMPMQQQMMRMYEEMQEIQRAPSADRRAELMSAHMRSMQQMMQMMHGMMAGQGIMGHHGGGMGMQMQEPMGPPDARARQQVPQGAGPAAMGEMMGRLDMMEQRMNMMQMMMDQMLKQQELMLEKRSTDDS